MTSTSLSGLMTAPMRMIEPEDTLDTAEQVLRIAHSRHWPVAHERELIGMISLRDLLTVQQPETEEERAHRLSPLKAAHIMSRARVVAHPDDTPSQAADRMRRHRLSCLPVVEDQRLLGVITLDDFVQYAIRLLRDEELERDETTPVSRLMTPSPVATVQLLEPITAAEALMTFYQVRHLPVTRLGRVVGIISDRDVLETYRRADECAPEVLVGEVMTATPFVTAPDESAIEAAYTLLDRRVGALPVMKAERLVGILTKSDFLGHVSTLAAARATT